MRLKTFYILLFIICSFLSTHGQTREIIEKLNLADSTQIKNKQIIVLADNAEFIVVCSKKVFLKSCKAWLKESSPKSIINTIQSIEKDKSKINISLIENPIDDFFERVFSSLLLEKKCLILNKKSKKLEKRLIVIDHQKENEYGLEYVSENNLLIFKTNWVSCF